jgi:TRAP-type C4-dicarboxylate transport system permease small subunit
MGAETRIVRLMARRSDNGTHGLRHAGDDAFQLTVDYLKQETVDPLRGLGRFLYMGIAGAFFLAFGILLILLGILRLLQTETGTALTGNWSWVPYAVVVVIGLGIIAIAVWRITAGPAQERMPAVAAAQRAQAAAQLETADTTQEATS